MPRAIIPSRLLTKTQAAAYCGVSIAVFDQRCPVKAVSIGEGARMLRWDIRALDQWIDGLGGQGAGGEEEVDWLEMVLEAADGKRARQRA